MNFLMWVENTWVAEVVRVSAYGYPAMITLHSLGLAIMVGLSSVLSLRALGWFRTIPPSTLSRLLKVAWVGFVVNFLSGVALFSTQATTYIVDWTFIFKMLFILAGAVFVVLLQTRIDANLRAAEGTVSVSKDNVSRIFAIGSIVAWAGATITGRLIAYL